MPKKEDETIKSKDEALIAARAASEKKAVDIIVLDLRKITVIADFFVICSGESTTQVRAISDFIIETLKKKDIRPLRVEGADHSHWILIDYGDCVVHIFETATRAYYELEKLWIDAERIAL